MTDNKLYLKPNVVMEPLFDRWYAWSHLISPATAAMNITGRHLKIMDSYIFAPHIHSAAVKNSKMKGGPFMDLNGEKVEEIKRLKQDTMENQKHLIEFSQAIKSLNELLKKSDGYSLEPLYHRVPDILKGYVELTYDLNNQPSFRLYESLLYKSKYFNAGAQSIALWTTQNDERPFVLSTPRLDSEDVLHLNIPFSHLGLDQLSRMKRMPNSVAKIKEALNITVQQEPLFDSFFTDVPPPVYEKYNGNKVRIRYFGHACILIETQEVSILIDPLVSYYGYQHDVSRFSDMDLPDTIDYILITHNHQDHILFETLLPLRHKVKSIIVPRATGGTLQDPNLKLMFNNIGFKNVVEIGEMEAISFQDCVVTGIPFIGEHCDLNIQAKVCYHVKVDAFTMFFAADSCNVEPMLYERIHEVIGDVDVIFLGMECEGAPLSWLYGPLLTTDLDRDKDQSRRLAGSNFDRAKALVDVFNPSEAYVYAMGQEPWLEFISSIKYTIESHPITQSDLLLQHCRKEGIVAERLFGEKEILHSKEKKVSMALTY
jgi:L-ascorbate metabolism protein UlaG (beta-lactamase superfamily)